MLLTDKLQSSSAIATPFPHIVVEDVLDKATLSNVTNSVPSLEKLTQGSKYGNNERFNYSANEIFADPQIDKSLKDLAKLQLSQAFLAGIVRLFGGFIPQYFPYFEKKFGSLDALKAGIRGKDNDDEGVDVLMDFQLASNTPVFLPGTTVRAPHIDCPKKLFVGLLYLRSLDDDSSGGDLELYTPALDYPRMDITRTTKKEDMSVFKTVPYKDNTLVLFLNTPMSYHGVTVRNKTKHPRLFLNLLGEMKEPIFDLGLDRPDIRHTTAGEISGFGNWKNFD